MSLDRASVHLSVFFPSANWNDMTRSWTGMIRRKSENPASADGPNCTSRIMRQIVTWIGAVHAAHI